MLKRYRKYITYLCLIVAVQSALIFALNWTIDPYKISDFIKINKFNQAKPEVLKQARLFKAVQIIHKTPKIVLLGSSRTDLGLDPSYFKEERAYNLGILGANMYEVLRYFQHAIANQPALEKAILGIDFFMFSKTRNPQVDFREDRLEKTHLTLPDLFNTTFSLNAITASFATVESNYKDPEFDPYEENGLRSNRDYLKSELPQGSIVKGFELSVQKFLNDPELYGNYQLSQEQLQHLQTFVELCQQNKIEFSIFISPAHAVQWETIQAAGLWEAFEQWKQEVVKIVPVWDFSGYNSITIEPVGDRMENYLDSSHYTQNVGDLILTQILQNRIKKVPPDFGVLLTPNNVKRRLDKIRNERLTWIKNHPDIEERFFPQNLLSESQTPV
jgi:hypothetical protein